MEPDERVIKTYVWHGEDCFFVSTIERTSSAMDNPFRYNETLVWRFDWKNRVSGALVGQGEAGAGSIRTHQRFVESLFNTGNPPED